MRDEFLSETNLPNSCMLWCALPFTDFGSKSVSQIERVAFCVAASKQLCARRAFRRPHWRRRRAFSQRISWMHLSLSLTLPAEWRLGERYTEKESTPAFILITLMAAAEAKWISRERDALLLVLWQLSQNAITERSCCVEVTLTSLDDKWTLKMEIPPPAHAQTALYIIIIASIGKRLGSGALAAAMLKNEPASYFCRVSFARNLIWANRLMTTHARFLRKTLLSSRFSHLMNPATV
jgi:hypothetical protein